MTVTVTFAGNQYPIPQSGERNWGSLTNYLVALSTAATTGQMLQGVRITTAASTNVQTSDFALFVNYAGAATVTLPSGVTKQIFAIFDKSGAAGTNNISIGTTGGQLIDGASSYVIKSNYGGVWVQFDGTAFKILSEYQASQRYSSNNATNASVVDASIVAKSTVAASADGTSTTVTFSGTQLFYFIITLDSGEGILCTTSFLSSTITALDDVSNIFLSSDAGVGIYVSKSSSSGAVTIKNRMGLSKNIEIRSLSARVASATAWA